MTSRVHEMRPSPTPAGASVPAGGEDLVEVDTEDVACLVSHATGNVVGTLTVSQVSPGRKNRLWIEVDAANSSVVFDQEDADWLWIGNRDTNELLARDGSASLHRFPSSSAAAAGPHTGIRRISPSCSPTSTGRFEANPPTSSLHLKMACGAPC